MQSLKSQGLKRFRKFKRKGRIKSFLREASVLQFSERLHFVSLKGLRKNFLETALKKTTRPIPFFSDASEFFPESLDSLEVKEGNEKLDVADIFDSQEKSSKIEVAQNLETCAEEAVRLRTKI